MDHRLSPLLIERALLLLLRQRVVVDPLLPDSVESDQLESVLNLLHPDWRASDELHERLYAEGATQSPRFLGEED